MLRAARVGCADEHERPALHHLPGSGVPDGQFPPVHAVPRVPLRARPHLLELVGADPAGAAPEECRFVGFDREQSGTASIPERECGGIEAANAWQEVAQTALDFVKRFVPAKPS